MEGGTMLRDGAQWEVLKSLGRGCPWKRVQDQSLCGFRFGDVVSCSCSYSHHQLKDPHQSLQHALWTFSLLNGKLNKPLFFIKLAYLKYFIMITEKWTNTLSSWSIKIGCKLRKRLVLGKAIWGGRQVELYEILACDQILSTNNDNFIKDSIS